MNTSSQTITDRMTIGCCIGMLVFGLVVLIACGFAAYWLVHSGIPGFADWVLEVVNAANQ